MNHACVFFLKENDIALIALSKPVNNVTLVKLPEASSTPSDYAFEAATIAGWGKTSFGNSYRIIAI